MSSGLAIGRLNEERKNWRKDHPTGFYARPVRKGEGETDIMHWEAGIPGKEGTEWENGVYKIEIKFSNDYPVKPPYCKFVPPIFHPNVFTNGDICLSILKEEDGWRPAVSLTQLLLAIQDLLTNPNSKSPANGKANELMLKKPTEYSKRLLKQAQSFETGKGLDE